MMNAGNLNGKARQMKDWRRRLVALVAALSLLISSCGLTAFAESDDDIYSAPVTAPIAPSNASPEPEETAEATPAPEGQEETGTEPAEGTGEENGTEPGEETGTGAEGEHEVSEEPVDLTAYEPGTLTAEADDIAVTLDYTAEARIPEGTVFTLARAAGGDLYTAMKSAARVLKEEQNETWKREMGDEALFYLLTLTTPEGTEIHPTAGVTLTCTNLVIPADATGFVTGSNAENVDWTGELNIEFLPDAIGYAYLKQVQIGTVTLVHEDRDYMVTASYGPDAGFPVGTQLKVREIMPGTPEYTLYSGMTDEALNEDWSEITLERYFDIAFVKGEAELEPQADVDVQITFRDKIEENEDTEVAAVHIENNEANVIESETDSQKAAKHDDEAIDTVAFTSDSFSVYGVVQKKKITKKVLAADGNTYEINVTYGLEAEIPENADLTVREILPEDAEFENYLNEAMRAASDESEETPLQTEYARFFDIEIIADGQKVEPKSSVSVSIALTDELASEQSDLCVVHFDEEEGAVVLEAKAEEATDIQFETESFSVYGVLTYPTAQPQGVYDLAGRSFLLSNGGNYMTTNIGRVNKNSNDAFIGDSNSNNASVFYFETTDQAGVYNIFTITSTGKKYINFSPEGWWADVSLSDSAQAFTVTKNDNGTYTITLTSSGNDKTYFFSVRSGQFNGATGDKNSASEHEMTLTFTASPTISDGKQYMVIVNYGGKYYIVNNDTTLTEVGYDPEKGTVVTDNPMLWTYDTSNRQNHLYFNSEAVGFLSDKRASDFYRRYLDPSSDEGWTEEEFSDLEVIDTWSDQWGNNAPWWDAEENKTQYPYRVTNRKLLNKTRFSQYASHIWSGDGGDWVGGKYFGVETDADGIPTKLVGNKSGDNAVTIIFADATKVKPTGTNTHTVNHIDISISGDSKVNVPLAFGTYYYIDKNDGQWKQYNVTSNTTLALEMKNVVITPDDMKHATIKAYDKNNLELDDAFTITGYSSNAHTNISTVQVRIEGNFKVANLSWEGGNDDNTKRQRKDNPITYVVSAVKPLEFELEDSVHGKLYEHPYDTEPLKVNIDVDMTASFNYFDTNNQCPPLQRGWGGNDNDYNLWQSGGIPTHGGTGMDFVLGGNAEQADANVVALEITKMIVDESGKLIHPKKTIVNTMNIYANEGANEDQEKANSVSGLNVGKNTSEADYSGYSLIHSKDISVGTTGMALVYDYAVKPGMYYITENNDDKSLPKSFIDTADNTWEYKGTYITTEYVRRGDQYDSYENPMHYSKTYTSTSETYASIPEVLGQFSPVSGEVKKNGILEFFVYNVYTNTSTTSLEVEKKWADDKIPENAEVTFELFFAKRQITTNNGTQSITPADWQDFDTYEKVKENTEGIFDSKLNTTLTLKASSAENQNWKGIFTGLPETWKDSNGNDWEIDYYAQETEIKVNGEVATEQYKATIEKTQPSGSENDKDGKVTITNEENDVEVKLRKVDASDGRKLGGAKFKLYPAAEYPDGTPVVVDENKCHLGNMGTPEDDEDELKTILVSKDDTGNFYAGLLVTGTYYLVEVDAPEGYQQLTEPVIIEIKSAKKEKNYQGIDVDYGDGQVDHLKMTDDKNDPPTYFYNVNIKNTATSKTLLTIQKDWVGGETREEINIVLKRYKKNEGTSEEGNDDETPTPKNNGKLEIVKTFNSDSSSGFAASYTVSGPQNYSETIQYSSFTNGKYLLEDLAAGTYTVTETVTGDVTGYTMTSSATSSQSETVADDTKKTVTFNGTYTLNQGSGGTATVILYLGYGNQTDTNSNTGYTLTNVNKKSNIKFSCSKITNPINSSDTPECELYYWDDNPYYSSWKKVIDLGKAPLDNIDVYIGEYDHYMIIINTNQENNTSGHITYSISKSSSSKALRYIASAGEVSGGSSIISIPDNYSYESTADQTITLNSGNEWTQTIEVEQADSEGNTYYYEIEEQDVPEDYEVTYTNKIVKADNAPTMTVTATNTYQKGKISVTKADIKDEGGASIEADNTYTFIIKKNDTQVGEPLTVHKNETATTGWLDFGEYTVEETDTGRTINGYVFNRVELSSGGTALSNPATITLSSPTTINVSATNYYDTYVEPVTVTVNKTWLAGGVATGWPKNDQQEYDPAYVTVQLQIRNAGSSDAFADIPGKTLNIYPVENTEEDQHTTATFSNLDPAYEYNVVEASELDEYESTVTGESNVFTVTNKRTTKINIEATKKWINVAADDQPTAVRFELFVEGEDDPIENSERIIVKDAGTTTDEDGNTVITWDGKAEWIGLKKYVDEDIATPVEITYIVKETGVYYGSLEYGHEPVWIDPALIYTVRGGTVTYDQTGKTGTVMISNTPKTIEVKVDKDWAPALEDGLKWTATFNLMQKADPDDFVIRIISISDESSDAEKTVTELPKYVIVDGTPQLAEYTVVETSYSVFREGEDPIFSYDGTNYTYPEGSLQYEAVIPQITPDDDGNLTIRVVNSQPTSVFKVKKEWLDVFGIDAKYLPAVKFRLIWFYTKDEGSVQNTNMPELRHTVEINNKTEFELNAGNNWEWTCPIKLPAVRDGLPVKYYVEEIYTKKPVQGHGEEAVVDVEYPDGLQLTQYQQEHFYILLDSYVNNLGTDTEWPTPYAIALQGMNGSEYVTGSITIRNRCPGEYLQMDLKKKFLEYHPDGSLWTTTSFAERMKSLILKVRLYRRIIKDEPITINHYHVVEGKEYLNNLALTGFEKYGEYMLIGYDDYGNAKAVNHPDNPFEIRGEGIDDEGCWHWTISNTGQNGGLPRYGFYKDPESKKTYAVRYEYLLVEEDAYKDVYGTPLDEFSWVAVLPAVWDTIHDGTAGQILLFKQEVAQDPDRLVNVQAGNLQITKSWNIDPDKLEVYVKVYRTINQSYDSSKIEDFTNKLNTSYDEWLTQYAENKDIGRAGILSDTYIYPNTKAEKDALGTDEKYIRIKGNGTVTIENVPAGCEKGAYRYWIQEVGYKDKAGNIHFADNDNPLPLTINYTVNSSDKYVIAPENFLNANGRIQSPIIQIGTKDNNHYTITNTIPYTTAKPVISKNLNGELFGGKDSAQKDKTFSFKLEQIYPSVPSGQTAYTQTVESKSNGTIEFSDIQFTDEGTFIYEISELGIDDDDMDYDGQKIYAKIEITKSGTTLTASAPKYYADSDCLGEELTGAVFNNYERGKLKLKKLVVVPASVTLPSNETNRDFTFKIYITVPDGVTLTSVPVTINGNTDDYEITKENSNSLITLHLKNNEEALIKNLPVGTTYTIEETDAPGYIMTWADDEDGAGTISKTLSEEVATNTYTVYTPVIEKRLNGQPFTGKLGDGTTTATFTFLLKAMIVEGTSRTISSETLQTVTTNADDGSITFNPIKYTDPGTYYYQIAEQPGADTETMSYDSNPVYLKVVVDSADLTVAATYYKDKECTDEITGTASFSNEERTKIEVTKIWTDGDSHAWPTDINKVTVGLYWLNGSTVEPYPDQANQMKIDITEDNEQKNSFTDLPVYDNNGALITYSIRELSITLTDGTTVGTRGDGNDYIQITGDHAQSWSVSETAVSNGAATVTNTPVKASFNIRKVNADDMATPLTGAKFKVGIPDGTDSDGNPKYNTVIDEFEVESSKDYEITGLTDGTYVLIETKAPDGYNMLSAPISFTVANGTVAFENGNSTVVYNSVEKLLKVGNTSGVALPSTGGSGTLIYTIAGMALIMLAGVLLVSRRKRRT